MPQDFKSFTANLPGELLERIAKRADERLVTRTDVVRDWLLRGEQAEIDELDTLAAAKAYDRARGKGAVA